MNSKCQNCHFIGVALTVLCFSTSAALAEDMKGLFVSTSLIDSGRQMLLVIDPERQVLAVYHIETISGKVSLRSTRALGYDLQLEDFNAEDYEVIEEIEEDAEDGDYEYVWVEEEVDEEFEPEEPSDSF